MNKKNDLNHKNKYDEYQNYKNYPITLTIERLYPTIVHDTQRTPKIATDRHKTTMLPLSPNKNALNHKNKYQKYQNYKNYTITLTIERLYVPRMTETPVTSIHPLILIRVEM